MRCNILPAVKLSSFVLLGVLGVQACERCNDTGKIVTFNDTGKRFPGPRSAQLEADRLNLAVRDRAANQAIAQAQSGGTGASIVVANDNYTTFERTDGSWGVGIPSVTECECAVRKRQALEARQESERRAKEAEQKAHAEARKKEQLDNAPVIVTKDGTKVKAVKVMVTDKEYVVKDEAGKFQTILRADVQALLDKDGKEIPKAQWPGNQE